MTPEEDQQERGEVVRRLEDEKLRLNREKAKLDPDPAGLDRQLAETEAKILRAKTPRDQTPLGEEDCFECWVDTAGIVPMTPEPGGYAEDIYRCRNGHERTVRR